jgi:DNA repair exonuclease SbcCD ATPase subunit
VVRVEVHVVADQAQQQPDRTDTHAEPQPLPELEPLLEAAALLEPGEQRRNERRAQKLDELEQDLRRRVDEVERREERVERRSVELETAFGLREDRIEQREAELAELQQRLERKERELSTYVAQIQSRLASSYCSENER